MKKKLEENKKNQKIFDEYLNLAVMSENVFARHHRGYNLFVSGHNAVKGVCILRDLGVETSAQEMVAGRTNAEFYKGDYGFCAIITPAGVFAAVRIHKDIFYTGVKTIHRKPVLDIARKTHRIYDLRALPIQALASKAKNVVHLAF